MFQDWRSLIHVMVVADGALLEKGLKTRELPPPTATNNAALFSPSSLASIDMRRSRVLTQPTRHGRWWGDGSSGGQVGGGKTRPNRQDGRSKLPSWCSGQRNQVRKGGVLSKLAPRRIFPATSNLKLPSLLLNPKVIARPGRFEIPLVSPRHLGVD